VVDISQTTAIVLAGGIGSRLRAVVSDRPKVLAPILDRPFLAYLLDVLDDAAIRHVVLCTGYMAELVEETFGQTYRRMRRD
jgi:D-glycero-alpha-D-manno-heptose 1-phosphate guanylyltransferase